VGTSAEVIAATLNATIDHVPTGSIRLFGAWIGRPHDNVHVLVAAHADDTTLILDFDKGERILIADAEGLVIDPMRFVIQRGTGAEYRTAADNATTYVLRHWLDEDDQIRSSSNFHVADFATVMGSPPFELN